MRCARTEPYFTAWASYRLPLVREVSRRDICGVMFDRCLFCDRPFTTRRPENGLSTSSRIAFDPDRRRIWTLCPSCHGWNLWPEEDRSGVLDALERTACFRARLLYQTDNIALLEADGVELIRVGRARRQEEAWWRYGRLLGRRHEAYGNALSRVGAKAYLAVSSVGLSFGLDRITGDFRSSYDRYTDVLRWRRFGRTAWSGRAPCPNCCSVLIRLFFFKSDALILLPEENGGFNVGMPCSRCDPWTVEKLHFFDGAMGERVLRRVLAYQNIKGASNRELDRAVGAIDAAGSPREFVRRVSAEPTPLHDLDKSSRLALEISVNEAAERRQLARAAVGLEAGWRRAEELAAIIDGEL